MLLFVAIILLVSCSGNSDGAKEATADNNDEVTADDLKEALGTDDDTNGEIDIEAIEEEMGIDSSGDAEIPDALPNDIPLPDDMEIEMTIDNELMAQVRIKTNKSIEELKEVYEEYLNSGAFSGEPTEEVQEMEGFYFIMYTLEYDEGEFSIQIFDDEDESD